MHRAVAARHHQPAPLGRHRLDGVRRPAAAAAIAAAAAGISTSTRLLAAAAAGITTSTRLLAAAAASAAGAADRGTPRGRDGAGGAAQLNARPAAALSGDDDLAACGAQRHHAADQKRQARDAAAAPAAAAAGAAPARACAATWLRRRGGAFFASIYALPKSARHMPSSCTGAPQRIAANPSPGEGRSRLLVQRKQPPQASGLRSSIRGLAPTC